MMNSKEQQKAAKEFVKRWEGKGDEKQETQRFWIDLLQNVLGVENPTEIIQFEKPVVIEKNTKFIDAYIPATKVLIEQKSAHIKLGKTAVQSDGEKLTPYGQAFRYNNFLPHEENARWIIVSNFDRILIYNMNKPNAEPDEVLLKDLEKDYYRLQFLVNPENENLKREMQISLQAGELVGKLYDAILKQYKNPNDPHTLKSLNRLCVWLVFCLYAEDANIFGKHQMFHNYMKKFSVGEFREKLMQLFEILNTKGNERDVYLNVDLLDFPYVNGGLFVDEIDGKKIEIPQFTQEIIDLLLKNASEDFDWSEISPTIFGAVFESTLNPETRRSGGMHYTSIENIHKVTDPLFLSELKSELEQIAQIKGQKVRNQKLEAFREKMSTLVFLDPACGSGNFLTETYLSLRKLENESIALQYQGQILMGEAINPIRVGISQFYGIEINDFAVTVARTALWIAESQMLHATEELINQNIEFLPLKSYPNITEGNALRINWEEVVPKEKLTYIMGNPPFVGARLMNAVQKNDVLTIFDGIKNNGNLDYVSCWYKKAADMMTHTAVRTALVSTNSITQGEQVAILWKTLFEQGVHIDFAYRTFRWDNRPEDESGKKQKTDKKMAAVHCVIVGFSKALNKSPKRLFDNGTEKIVKNINGYLVEADDIVISSRSEPICNVTEIGMGNQPIDDGNYLFTEEEMLEFIKKEPKSKQYFKKWLGAKEFINGYYRYCLWLGDCSPKELRSMPECLKRVEAVKTFRLSSKRKSTLKLSETPTHFQTENMPKGHYIVIPEVSSEKRKYIPIGFLDQTILCSNKLRLMPNATLFDFGILTSNVHMAWMRAVAGRLEMRYDYSINIVYNNFPWCSPTPEQKTKIEQTAQAILDARAIYTDSSLADLYDETTMPPKLRKAHQANDKAVMQAYGFWGKLNTESECVAELMKMYQALIKDKTI